MDFGYQSVIYPMKGLRYQQLLLVISKILKALAYFASYEVLKQLHSVSFLLALKLCAAITLLQKPLSDGRPLSASEWFQVARFSFVRLLLDFLWIEGLYLCGPLRFILLFEHSETLVLAAASTIVYGTTTTSKTRGTIFFILGILGVTFFDHDMNHVDDLHPEGVHKSLLIHKIYELFANFGLSDHKVGVVVLMFAVCLDAGFAAISRSMVSSLGGAKRIYALSSLVSLAYLIPLFVMSKLYGMLSTSLENPTEPHTILFGHGFREVLRLLFVLLFIGTIAVMDFYVTSLVSARLGSHAVTHLAKSSITITALFICFMWTSGQWIAEYSLPIIPSSGNAALYSAPAHQLSAGVLFAIAAILYASTLLTNMKSGHGPDGSSSGHFIGYSMTGLPLFTAGQTPSHGMALLSDPETMGVWYHVRTTLRDIMSEQASMRIFVFLCLNLSFTFVELLYGVWTNSLGLISDGFHMLFDSAALVIGLYAAVVSQWNPTRVFSYGFHSAEVLSGFVNALFLLVISSSVFINALARIHQPPHIHTDRLMAVSVAGLLVNLVGVLALGHAHSHGGRGGGCNASGHSHDSTTTRGHGHTHSHQHDNHTHNSALTDRHVHYGHAHGKKQCGAGASHTSHSGSGGNANLRGVYLHVLADTLGSVGVICSSYLVSTYGWNIADPICSVFIACAIGYSAIPLLQDTLSLLTLRAPDSQLTASPKWIVQKILELDGVMAVYNPFMWCQTRDSLCVSVCVRVECDVPEPVILAKIKDLINVTCHNLSHVTVQVEKVTPSESTPLQTMGTKSNVLLYFPKNDISNGPVICPIDSMYATNRRPFAPEPATSTVVSFGPM